VFYKFLSIIMTIVFILSIVLLVITYHKPKKLSVQSLFIAIGISFLTLVIFSSLIGYKPSGWVCFTMIVIGAAIGVFWSRVSKVYLEKNQVMANNSVWYLVAWGAIFVLNQLITIATSRPPGIAMAMLIMSSAIVWGMNGSLLGRYYKVSSVMQPGARAFSDANTADNAEPQGTSSYENAMKRFGGLKQQLQIGKLDAEGFRSALEEVRFQDDSGTWWQLSEDEKSWLKWDGSKWISQQN
jgi:hypothetical protein